MCQQGVKQFVAQLSGRDVNSLAWLGSESVRDGFGRGRGAPNLLLQVCPVCGERFPVVERPLESEAYNLPDVAVYQRVRYGQPCVAVGRVTRKTTPSRNPDRHFGVAERWQGLMWHVYQVAFLDVRDDSVGQFQPTEDWGVGEPPTDLPRLCSELQARLRDGREAGIIPAGNSRGTEQALAAIVTPVMREQACGWCWGCWRGAPGVALSSPPSLPQVRR